MPIFHGHHRLACIKWYHFGDGSPIIDNVSARNRPHSLGIIISSTTHFYPGPLNSSFYKSKKTHESIHHHHAGEISETSSPGYRELKVLTRHQSIGHGRLEFSERRKKAKCQRSTHSVLK
ncbi:hypothetical protein NPIL_623001 [Nephila pilipes]|uniref:Uncharacterized protein n=1 Tax=Nephila pilipes TaxID=299642 RepID=A0A8X6MWY8_NEPPI|nr:hypothetical protein NPIL_623001 [Nephila pilipes]